MKTAKKQGVLKEYIYQCKNCFHYDTCIILEQEQDDQEIVACVSFRMNEKKTDFS